MTTTGAFAQSATSDSTTVGEIVVTGSRIPQPNLKSVSPVTAVTARRIQQIGAPDVVDILNQLPQTSLGGNSLNNAPNPLDGSGGFTTVDLRGLGTVRTLVLENGKRLQPGDPTLGGEAADLDTIPSALIDRIDVVTGGASAVYGSDAEAGVVNFIMKHNYQGAQIDLDYGVDEHDNDDTKMQSLERAFGVPAPSGTVWDGMTYNATGTVGVNSPNDKGNITAYFSYHDQEPVSQSARDYSACELSQSSGPASCIGSSNSNLFVDNNGDGTEYSVRGAAPNNVFSATRDQTSNPPAQFNSNPYEYLTRGDKRYLGGFFAHYQASPAADFYSDFAYMDDNTTIQVAPSALFQQTFNVNCANPFLSAQQVADLVCAPDGNGVDQAQLTIGRRNVEGGPRVYSYAHLSYRLNLGVRGDLGDAWHYDAYAQYGRTTYQYNVQNDISLARIQDGLEVVGTAANPVCMSGGSCVPYNIFSDGGVTQAAAKYISEGGSTIGDTEEQIVSANITGQLGKYGIRSPFSSDGVSINFGAEYRNESLDQVPDAASISGDLSGAGGALPAVHGSFNVQELFSELQVPIVQDKPFIKELDFNGGYRFSRYSLQGKTDSYKLGLDYSPNSDIRFRASYQRAVRAPNVNELFSAPQITDTSTVGTDPCAPTVANGVSIPATATLAQCEHTGVTAAEYGNGQSPSVGGTDKLLQCVSSQCSEVEGGNTKLTPEYSNTYSYGVVITPVDYISGLSLSVDYFRINIQHEIAPVPINITLDDCLVKDLDCNLIVRQFSNGSLFGSAIATGGYITGLNANLGYLETSGFDFAGNYHFDLSKLGLEHAGQLSFDFEGTLTQDLVTEPVEGGSSYNCAGLYGPVCVEPNPTATPKWRHNFRVTYDSPLKFSVSLQWRYLGGVGLDANTNNNLLNNGMPAGDVADAHIPAYNYFDLSASYTFGKTTIRAGCNNLFDKDPPVLDAGVVGSGAPNTLNNYDELGRVLFIGLTAKL